MKPGIVKSRGGTWIEQWNGKDGRKNRRIARRERERQTRREISEEQS